MIISILGTSGKKEVMPFYSVSEPLKGMLKEECYINSTDALLKNVDEKFLLIGTKEAIEVQKELLCIENNNRIAFKEYDQQNLAQLFEIIYQSLNTTEKIIFDITHSFRDSVIMSIISTITRSFVSSGKIDIIFAKEVERLKRYEYVKINEFLDISQMAFLLSTFHQTLNIPKLPLQNPLYSAMEEFSKDILANEITTLLNTTYPRLKDALTHARDNELSFMKELCQKIIDELSVFDLIKSIPHYQKYYYLARLMFEKNYNLIAFTYLHESIPYYIHYHLKEIGYFFEKEMNYDFGKRLKAMLAGDKERFLLNEKHVLKFNSKAFLLPLGDLYEKIRESRNQLAHLGAKIDEDAKEKLLRVLLSYKKLIIQKDILLKLPDYSQIVKRTAEDGEDEHQKRQELCLLLKKEINDFWSRNFETIYNPVVIEELLGRSGFTLTPKKLRKTLEKLLDNEEFMQIMGIMLNYKKKRYSELSDESAELIKNFKLPF